MLFTWIAALLAVLVTGTVAAIANVLNPVGNALVVWGVLFWAPLPIKLTAVCGMYFFTIFASTWVEVCLAGAESDATAKVLADADGALPSVHIVSHLGWAKLFGLIAGILMPAMKPMGFINGLDTLVIAVLALMAVGAIGAQKSGVKIPTVFAAAAVHMGIVLVMFALGSVFQMTNLVFILGNALFIPMMLNMKGQVIPHVPASQQERGPSATYMFAGFALGFISLFAPGASHYVLLVILPPMLPALFGKDTMTEIQRPALQMAATMVEAWNLKVIMAGGASSKTAIAGMLMDGAYNGGSPIVTVMQGHWAGLLLFIAVCVVVGLLVSYGIGQMALRKGAPASGCRKAMLRSVGAQVFMALIIGGPVSVVFFGVGFLAYEIYKRTGLLKALPSIYTLTYLAPVIAG